MPFGIGVWEILILLVVAAVQGWTAWDSRMPLLLVDEQGVRLRFGQTWQGIPWSKIESVEHTPRPDGIERFWKDGRIGVLHASNIAIPGRWMKGWQAMGERMTGLFSDWNTAELVRTAGEVASETIAGSRSDPPTIERSAARRVGWLMKPGIGGPRSVQVHELVAQEQRPGEALPRPG